MRLALLLPFLALVACAEDVAKDKVMAEVAPAPAPVAAPAAAPAGAAATAPELTIDKSRSKINALGAKVTGQHDIVFPEFDGKVRLDGETPTSLSFTVQVAALQTSPEKLVTHFKSADFFEVEAHPTATFTSSEIKPLAGQGDNTHEVTGDLTLRGVTRRVTFPARITVTPTDVTGHAQFGITRQDFNIVYKGKADDLIQDNVVLTVDLVAPRA